MTKQWVVTKQREKPCKVEIATQKAEEEQRRIMNEKETQKGRWESKRNEKQKEWCPKWETFLY